MDKTVLSNNKCLDLRNKYGGESFKKITNYNNAKTRRKYWFIKQWNDKITINK
jgi:hypothetical protein